MPCVLSIIPFNSAPFSILISFLLPCLWRFQVGASFRLNLHATKTKPQKPKQAMHQTGRADRPTRQPGPGPGQPNPLSIMGGCGEAWQAHGAGMRAEKLAAAMRLVSSAPAPGVACHCQMPQVMTFICRRAGQPSLQPTPSPSNPTARCRRTRGWAGPGCTRYLDSAGAKQTGLAFVGFWWAKRSPA